ncbi:TnsA-like heteromeric transposase endonuclease subunit [Streptomyces pratens]|uniref:TnsA-like heteromeric transposase endonuclease subunit n=1 Tax=Streptomyces pratens TaxID=887456 RepID=A0ABW1LY02_9ACTN
MWPVRFESAGQVRVFPSYRGQRNFSGWYWAATSADLVGYESWVELSHLMRLDAEPEVCGVVSQPFRLSWRYDGRSRRVSHTPDYFVRRRDGRVVVLDVRPDELVEPEDAVKFAATAVACARVGWDYERVGVLGPVLAANRECLINGGSDDQGDARDDRDRCRAGVRGEAGGHAGADRVG